MVTCHHIHNTTKIFCLPFNRWVEDIFVKIFNDFHWSTDMRDYLEQICEILNLTYTAVERHVPHRWLSCYDISVTTISLYDAYTVFYYSFMSSEDRKIYFDFILIIYKKYKVSLKGKVMIKEIQQKLQKKKLTVAGKDRKKALVSKIIVQNKKTLYILNFYISSLAILKEYVCLFQSNTPLVHKLHVKQLEIFKEFLAGFIEIDVSSMSADQVKDTKFLNLQDKSIFLPKKNMLIGSKNAKLITAEYQKDTILCDCLVLSKKAYIKTAEYLQLKLPLDNKVIKCMSGLDPAERVKSSNTSLLRNLPILVRNVLTSTEEELYEKELRKYQVSSLVPPYKDKDGKEINLDIWWAAVEGLNLFPCLTKMSMALMSCFHGPAVESSFNVMGDIIGIKSARMKISTYSSVQTVKYKLRSKKTLKKMSAIEMYGRKDAKYDPVDLQLSNNISTAYKCYRAEVDEINMEKERKRKSLEIKKVKMLSKKKSKEILAKAEKEAKLKFKKERLAKLNALVEKRKKHKSF